VAPVGTWLSAIRQRPVTLMIRAGFSLTESSQTWSRGFAAIPDFGCAQQPKDTEEA
jgi:hypothetical protein